MSEVVDSSDPEFVLRVLETCLLTQWDDVTREGGTIVLRGLGPSHRALNRNDRTVFTTTAAEGQKTTIAADVTYQASALVGTAAPQNEMVQRKLDAVLEMVRMDLDLAQRRRAQAAERAGEKGVRPTLVPRGEAEVVPQPMPAEPSAKALPRQVPVEPRPEVAQVAPEPMVRVEPVVAAPSANIEASAVEASPEVPAVAARNEPPVVPPAPRSEPPSAPAPRPYFQPHDDAERTANPVEVPIAFQNSRRTLAAERPMDMEEIRLVHREEADDEIEDEDPGSGIAKVFVTLMVLVVLAAGGWEGWQHRAQIEQTHAWAVSRAWVMQVVGKSAEAGGTPAAPASVDDSGTAAVGSTAGAAPVAGSTPAASGSASTLTEGPVPPAGTSTGGAASVAGSPASSAPGGAAATPEDAAAAEKAAEEEKLSELDPAKWLQNWAEAMRGTDAALLAQYYADPVNRYYLQSHVSRARVMADKQATMAKREQPWTVQLDNVQVLDRTPSTARVLLIKHFSMGRGAAARQVRWPTQLRLKMIDGRWEITSEQTLGE